MTTWLSLEADSPSADKTAAPGDSCAKTFSDTSSQSHLAKVPSAPWPTATVN